MFEKILAISGKPGLFTLVSRSQRGLIVETLDSNKKRMPIFGTDKVTALAEIAMYTDEEEVALRQVMANIKANENGQPCALQHQTATRDELIAFMTNALPNYDRDRVRLSDMKKLLQWYNLLVSNGVDDFETQEEAVQSNEAQPSAE